MLLKKIVSRLILVAKVLWSAHPCKYMGYSVWFCDEWS